MRSTGICEMDRMQIGFKLAMDALGIPIIPDNYQRICDAVYLAKRVGAYISPARILWDAQTGHAYSPLTHETGGHPSRNLLDDILEIRGEVEEGWDESVRWVLDEASLEKIERVRKKLAA